jgi:selenocysteine-specific elongation factor
VNPAAGAAAAHAGGDVSVIVIGTAGHIDHGKSTLVKALTGTDPDRLKEEQERGITTDLGFAHVTAGDVTLSFVDVPGHERFVRNMLAGAGGIDAVVLVVAADEAVKPQTREHFDITRLIGIDRGVIALTKADLADADARELAALDVREMVAGSFLERAPVIPVSARTGEGLQALVQALAALAGPDARQARAGVVRLPVDRVFPVKGFGTVVTGTLVSGVVREGDSLTILPRGQAVRVRGAHVHGRPVKEVRAPSRAAINLSGVDAGELARGVTLATAGALAVTRRADLLVRLLPSAPPLKHGAKLRLHHGTADALARLLVAAVRPAGGAWQPARPGDLGVTVPPGGEAFARVRLDRPFVLTRGDRAVLRLASPAITVGGGLVLDPEPPSGGVRRAGAFARFDELQETPAAAALWLSEAQDGGLDAGSFVRRGGLDAAAATALVVELVARGVAAGSPAQLLDRQVADRIAAEEARLALAAQQPERSPEEERVRLVIEDLVKRGGLTPPDDAALAREARLEPAALERLLQGLVRDRRLVRLDGVHFHPDALDQLKADTRALKAGSAAPAIDVATFKARYGLSRKFAIPLLEWLDRERVTRRVGEKRIVL